MQPLDIACPGCGESLVVPAELKPPRLAVVDGNVLRLELSVDREVIDAHMATCHGGDPDGGEPVQCPDCDSSLAGVARIEHNGDGSHTAWPKVGP